MDKSELDSLLKKARTPERSEEFWEEFPRRIVSGIKREQESWSSSFGLSKRRASDAITPKRELHRLFPRLAWGFATAVCILAAFVIGHWRGQMETQASADVLANAKLIHEVLAMFPNQVRAIVQDERGLQLLLSAQPDVPLSTPLWVKICDGNQCASLVTFSGQELEIAGQKITILSDAQGGIILEGSRFVWSSSARNFAQGGLKIEAKRLNSISL